MSEGQGTAIIKSCQDGQTSLTGERNSLFTKHVLGAFEHANRYDNTLDVFDLFRYVTRMVPAEAARAVVRGPNNVPIIGHIQIPEFHGKISGAWPIALFTDPGTGFAPGECHASDEILISEELHNYILKSPSFDYGAEDEQALQDHQLSIRAIGKTLSLNGIRNMKQFRKLDKQRIHELFPPKLANAVWGRWWRSRRPRKGVQNPLAAKPSATPHFSSTRSSTNI